MVNNYWYPLVPMLNYASGTGLAELFRIFGIVIGVCAGLVLIWFGARKITGAVMSALKRGSLRF